jgi:cytoskeleton protein RodZ
MATVAEQLRSERERQNLSVHQVAEATKIKTDHIRALEEGRYEVFAAPIYIRGFVRSYASLLKLEAAQLVKKVEAELSQTAKFHEPASLTGERRGVLDFLMLQLSKMNWQVGLWIIGLALVCSVSLGVYFAWQSYSSADPLAKLGPGLYQAPQAHSGELLPLPSR